VESLGVNSVSLQGISTASLWHSTDDICQRNHCEVPRRCPWNLLAQNTLPDDKTPTGSSPSRDCHRMKGAVHFLNLPNLSFYPFSSSSRHV